MGMITEKDIYFITLQHCVVLLKEELQKRYPTWNYKLGHHHFFTYTTDKAASLEDIHDLPIIFKLASGQLLQTGSFETIEKEAQLAQEKYQAQTIHRWDLVEEDGIMGDRKVRGPVIDIIRFTEGEYALGVRLQIRGDFAPFKGSSPIPCPDINMKHGYQKIGEAFKHFRPHVGHDEVFLDIGCAPGGCAYYLLEHGYRVIGVDVTDVDTDLKEKFKEGFLHLREPINEINVKHLKGLPPIDWVVSDIDLAGREVLPLLAKLISKLDECQGLFFHVRVDDSFELAELENIKKTIQDIGFGHIKTSLLPSDGKEFCLFAKKEE
jgi:hypothetical protein